MKHSQPCWKKIFLFKKIYKRFKKSKVIKHGIETNITKKRSNIQTFFKSKMDLLE